MKVAFIINPISGGKDKAKLPEIINNTASNNHIQADIVYTARANHAAELARELMADGYSRIVAVGGDGTINEVARELVGKDAELAIIPQGSGNGLARHLGIPLTAPKAVEVALLHPSQRVDAAYINGVAFFCTAGVGFDALIGNRFAEAGSRGLTTYAKVAIKEFFGYKPKAYTITVDGQRYSRSAFLITVANASQYGNNAYIAPQADLQDGILDVVVVTKLPLISGPAFAAKMFLKKIESSQYVEIIRGRNITIEREEEDYIHFDGEPGRMGKTLEISVQPSSLKVVF
ncbi:diacylglycerol kinase family lipid kinase [uncultured Acetobacteroides sp.]|uniref:diacylglycerol/lipid kinase family protein n=1 Tax=uncultured Acetobacteroides sp. TaxID=1760811 RepID=UPI0029F5090B|nr:diacylglycerol kinase family lipid kinase [uncultured Acetobacteroides sp.]